MGINRPAFESKNDLDKKGMEPQDQINGNVKINEEFNASNKKGFKQFY